jgi:hypothetical protein
MNAPPTSDSRTVLGMISLVLGTIALLLFFLPIVSIPISASGLIFGLVGTIIAVFVGRADLRWSFLGLTVSLLALLINLAIVYAPGDTLLPGYH